MLNILEYIGVQINTHSENDEDLKGEYNTEGKRVFETYYDDVNNKEMDLKEKEIFWDDLGNVDMAYNDLYGIHYLVPFGHPDEYFEPASINAQFNFPK